MTNYTGSCHCGDVKFSFESDEIKEGLRCNCSICQRKGALMSSFVLQGDELTIDAKDDILGIYQFDNKIAKHYFCKSCGIYPFHETVRAPGSFRVNLGCLDGIDPLELETALFDGKNLL